MVAIDLAETPVREANERIRESGAAGEDVDVLNPDARHHIGVGLIHPITVRVRGSAGYFCAGLTDGARFEVDNNVGWGLADNMYTGSVVVGGNAGAIAGVAIRGAEVVVKGNIGSRAGQVMKAGTMLCAGNANFMAGYMMYGGRIVILGDSGGEAGRGHDRRRNLPGRRSSLARFRRHGDRRRRRRDRRHTRVPRSLRDRLQGHVPEDRSTPARSCATAPPSSRCARFRSSVSRAIPRIGTPRSRRTSTSSRRSAATGCAAMAGRARCPISRTWRSAATYQTRGAAADPVSKVRMRTLIGGKNGANPLDLSMPVLIAPMSYGALSRSTKQAVGIASGLAGIAENTGEGGMSDAQRGAAKQLIFQCLGGRLGWNIHDMNRADGLEIYISQGAKPGFGGQLMAKKVTQELADIRGIPAGIDLRSPSRHPDILGADDLVIKVEEFREATGYRLPVSVKLGAGRIRDDIKIAVKDGFDFVELDGMQGSTGAGGAEVMEYVGIPTISAIVEALDALAEIGRRDAIEIVLMGGIRDGVDGGQGAVPGRRCHRLGHVDDHRGRLHRLHAMPRRPMRHRHRDPGPRAREALQAPHRGPQHPPLPGRRALADRRVDPCAGLQRRDQAQPRRPGGADARGRGHHSSPLRAPNTAAKGSRRPADMAVERRPDGAYETLVPDELADDTGDLHFVPAPCQIACPVGTDAPSYIAYIWEGKFAEAFEAITVTNPFSSICGRVCDAPCEPACRRTASDGPLQIRNLKRFVMDKLGAAYAPEPAAVTRAQSVGVVGAGPAGLVAAHDLAVAGFKVDVYEMTDRPGGLMAWGIPAFRLPPGIIDEDLARLEQRCPGIDIHLNTALGRDVALDALKARHDAVLLTIRRLVGQAHGHRGRGRRAHRRRRRVSAPGQRRRAARDARDGGGGRRRRCGHGRLPGRQAPAGLQARQGRLPPRRRRDTRPQDRTRGRHRRGYRVRLQHPPDGHIGERRRPGAALRYDRAGRARRGRPPPAGRRVGLRARHRLRHGHRLGRSVRRLRRARPRRHDGAGPGARRLRHHAHRRSPGLRRGRRRLRRLDHRHGHAPRPASRLLHSRVPRGPRRPDALPHAAPHPPGAGRPGPDVGAARAATTRVLRPRRDAGRVPRDRGDL